MRRTSKQVYPQSTGVPVFNEEFRALNRHIRLLKNKGRTGGVIALGISLALAAPTVWLLPMFGPWNGERAWSPAITVLSMMMLATALGSGVAGVRYLLWPAQVPERLSREEFLRLLRRHAKPCRVCLQCRIFVDEQVAPECEQCLSTRDCFNVTSDADVAVVAAAIPQ